MNRVGILLAGGLLLCVAAGCAQTRFNNRWKNKPAPDFELTTLEGGKARLSAYRGKPVLLTFWGHT